MVIKPRSESSVGNQKIRKAIVNPESSDSASHLGGLLHSSPSRTTSAAVKFKTAPVHFQSSQRTCDA